MGETGDTKTGFEDVNRKKQSRGRGRSVTGRGRGSKANDQTRPQISSAVLSSNGQLENLSHEVYIITGMVVLYGLVSCHLSVTPVFLLRFCFPDYCDSLVMSLLTII